MEILSQLGSLWGKVAEDPAISSLLGALVAGIAGTGIFSFGRRVKTEKEHQGDYFAQKKLLKKAPIARPAYSDRMAYVMAELSDLAYYRFEGQSGFLDETAEKFMNRKLDKEADIRRFLESFSKRLLSNRELSLGVLEDVLKDSKFELIGTVNVGGTQGFACKCTQPGESPYVVIAFRGTEKKVSDWLTDADAVPYVEDKTTGEGKCEIKVHSGFRKAFQVETDDDNKTVEDRVREIMDSDKAKDKHGEPLPLFITGHSLGGALALLATRNVAPDVRGACYTFGAPRVANYEYFEDIKTPVYRIVNSSDVVPRVPPGAAMTVIINLVRLLSWVTGFIPSVSKIFDKLEHWLDKLNGYRHFGDLRYLTDIAGGRFEDVELLRNPPAIDRAIWAWKHMAASVFVPINNHGMMLYRKKLAEIAKRRNRAVA